jgi:hypothetical protein
MYGHGNDTIVQSTSKLKIATETFHVVVHTVASSFGVRLLVLHRVLYPLS